MNVPFKFASSKELKRYVFVKIDGKDKFAYNITFCAHKRANVCKAVIRTLFTVNRRRTTELCYYFPPDKFTFHTLITIFAYDLFLHSNKWKRVCKYLNRTNICADWFIYVMFKNHLMVKYIMHRSSIWKPLFTYVVKRSTEKSDAVHVHIISQTYKYLKWRHVLWLLKIDFIALLVCRVNMYMKEVFETTELTEDDLWLWLDPVNRITYRIKNVCELTNNWKIWKTFRQRYHSEIKKLVNMYKGTQRYYFCVQIQDALDLKKPNAFRIVYEGFTQYTWQEKLCGWIKCKIDADKLYVCKGCKLVQYCCRKHQKKDWKMIHSTQCLTKWK
eukprot:27052_1